MEGTDGIREAPSALPASPRGAWTRALRDAWALTHPYFRARGAWRAWLLLAAVIALTVAGVALNVLFSNWNNRFYDALQNRDLATFWRELGVFCGLAAVFILTAVYRQYLQQVLLMHWRTWLTHELLGGWLQPGTAYRIGMRTSDAGRGQPDNPDQRIAEDIRGFVATTLELSLGLLNAAMTLVSFTGILWRLSGVLALPMIDLRLPGFMVWVALGYSLLGSWIAQRLGGPLILLNGRMQQVEADFRYALVRLRENAEAVALARGEAREHAEFAAAFDAIRGNWSSLIRAAKRLTWFSAGFGQVANVFPILAAAPRYFSGAMQLGGLMQTAQAFGQVQGATSWFVDAYPRLADWRATVNRLATFSSAVRRDGEAAFGTSIVRVEHEADAIQWTDLVVDAPGGQAILAARGREIRPGASTLLVGPSGSGKSSLLRAIAGLWRDGGGEIRLPRGRALMFVPQRPYLPHGSLRAAIAYPLPPEHFSDDAIRSALQIARLQAHAPRLDGRQRWSEILSPGEQQRVHFARVLLHRPDWVFLDESTSALDESAERELYGAVRAHCPGTTVVSVGHRSTLRDLHARTWAIEDLLQDPDPADGLTSAARCRRS